MPLSWEEKPAVKVSTRLSQHITVDPGQTFKIETTPDGIESLSELCPMDESWDVHYIIEVTVTPV